MSRGFVDTDKPGHEGATNTWLTPLELVHSLGEFDLDPCAYPGHKTAKKLIVLPDCGLTQDWVGRVWLNPPYGKNIGLWLAKLKEHGNGIALVFGRTDTKWFHGHGADMIFFIRGRLKFLKPETMAADTNAGHGSVLLAYGEHNINAINSSGINGFGVTL